MTQNKKIKKIKIILIVIEIIGVCFGIVYGVLWVIKPNGPYESITFLSLLIGSTIVDIIRRYLPPSEKEDSNPKLETLSDQITKLIKLAEKGELSIAELNLRINKLCIDTDFEINDPMRFRLCPKCGSTELNREIIWDRHNGMDLGIVKCRKCVWKESNFLGANRYKVEYLAKYPGIKESVQ